MRVGITLPQFRDDADGALTVARLAEVAGLDGVFVFDHLWPLGQPHRPALHSTTLLGALVAETERVVLGTLVARVGLVPDAVLVHTLVTLHRMAGGRFIAGLGTGDRANRAENEAYGIAFAPAAERLASVLACARQLRANGVPTWIGGLSDAVVRAAAAEADGWNGWGISAERLAAYAAALAGTGTEVTWAGQVTGSPEDLAAHLRAVGETGASWAICAPVRVGGDEAGVELVAKAMGLARSAGPPWPGTARQ